MDIAAVGAQQAAVIQSEVQSSMQVALLKKAMESGQHIAAELIASSVEPPAGSVDGVGRTLLAVA